MTLSDKQRKLIKKMYDDGVEDEVIANQFEISLEELDNIIDSFETEPSKEKKTKDIEDKMDSNAESSVTGEILRRTKGVALAIQKAKEEIGDYIYELFENSGIPVEMMSGFAEEAVKFFIENHDSIETLQAELDTAEDMIEKLWEVADEKSAKERLIRDYLMKCATEGTPVDRDFVKSMIMDTE